MTFPRKRAILLTAFALLLALAVPLAARAQAVYAGTGPGDYINVGVTVSSFNSDYGKRDLAGATLFVDGNLYRRIGSEFEARRLSLRSDDGTRLTTFLGGVKISSHGHTLRPYAKLLAGKGTFQFPYAYAHGSYFVAAPGAGLDWRVHYSRVTIRLVDVEYQFWPQFSFGPLHPYGVSTGIALRVFGSKARRE